MLDHAGHGASGVAVVCSHCWEGCGASGPALEDGTLAIQRWNILSGSVIPVFVRNEGGS